jgi:hypothetical protein
LCDSHLEKLQSDLQEMAPTVKGQIFEKRVGISDASDIASFVIGGRIS